MEQSSPCDANSRKVCDGFIDLWQNVNLHYYVQNNTSLDPIMSHFNPLYTLKLYLF